MALKRFMAKGDSAIEKPAERAVPLRADAPVPRTVSPSTSVDAFTEFDGKLRCKQTLRIDGKINGEVECDTCVIVGETARVHASISADEVQVAGLVKGDIAARRKITLARTAVVTGDLTTPGIVIEEGAKLKGRIVIGSDPEPVIKETKKAKTSRKPLAAEAKPKEISPSPLPAPAPA